MIMKVRGNTGRNIAKKVTIIATVDIGNSFKKGMELEVNEAMAEVLIEGGKAKLKGTKEPEPAKEEPKAEVKTEKPKEQPKRKTTKKK